MEFMQGFLGTNLSIHAPEKCYNESAFSPMGVHQATGPSCWWHPTGETGLSMPSKPKVEVIRFTASVSQVRTMADGGLRVILDFDERAINAATALMKVKNGGGVLEIAAVPVLLGITNGKNKTDRRTTRSPIDLAGG